MKISEKLAPLAAAAVLPLVTLFFVGPSVIYFGNAKDLGFSYGQLWPYLALAVLLGSALLIWCLYRIAGNKQVLVVSLVLVLGILLWLQGSLMVWNYGLWDGSSINWREYWWYGIIDSLVWAGLILLGYRYRHQLYALAVPVSCFVLVLQLGSLAYTGLTAPVAAVSSSYDYDKETMVDFSAQQNVIIMVLDSYYSGIFQEIITADPQWFKELHGFTYFRNAVGGYPTTAAAIPLLLTGQYYDNSQPYDEYVKRAYQNGSIPAILQKNRFRTELYPQVYSTVTGAAADNYVLVRGQDKGPDLGLIGQLTMFRYVPHYFKALFYEPELAFVGDEEDSSDRYFYKRLQNEAQVTFQQPVFKFYHLRSPHPPFTYQAGMVEAELPQDAEGYRIQAEAALSIAREMVEQLERLNIYDRSLICIVGDHGYPNSNVLTSGSPLVLVKPFNASGDMKSSDAPVSMADLPATVAACLDSNAKINSGTNMMAVGNDEQRMRRFLYYSWAHDDWAQSALPEMTEYAVQGLSWESSSWVPTGKVFTEEGVKNLFDHSYVLGSRLVFQQEGNNSQSYQSYGWSSPEKEFTWTDGSEAGLFLPITPGQGDLQLSVKLRPFLVNRKLEQQQVEVYINGRSADSWILEGSDWQNKTIDISEQDYASGLLRLTFKLPDARSPQSLGLSEDKRQLAAAVNSLTITSTSSTGQ